MNELKISIITASYNASASIRSSIESIENQTYPHIERIWVDGDSTDGTKEYLSSKAIELNAIYISEKDCGIYDALNKGLALSSGEIIGFLHADDVLPDRKILAEIAEAFKDEKVDIIYGDLCYVKDHENSKIVRYWRANKFQLKSLKFGWMPPHPTLYVRRKIFQKLEGFNIQYKISGDYDLILRLFSLPDLKYIYLDKVIVNMKMGGKSNRSINTILLKSLEDYRSLKRNQIGGAVTLLCKNLRKSHQFFFQKK